MKHLSPQGHRPLSGLCLLAMLAVLATTACGGPPRKALADAQAALTDASNAAECAPEQYAAARKMLERARAASAAEEYDEAKELALSAKRLADKAEMSAQANLSKCKERQRLADMEPEEPEEEPQPLMEPAFTDGWTLTTIYFGFNSTTLPEPEREKLSKNAQWINDNPDVQVTISGHCDDRGSTEYNLALGEQRAASVRKFLSTLGVESQRLAIISYGEEVPVDTSGSAGSYARNRRAEFRVD